MKQSKINESSVIEPQRILSPSEKREIVEELNSGKTRMILNIIGYVFLILGTMTVYITFIFEKISFGFVTCKINEDLVKKYTAIGLIVVWSIFLTAECFKIDDFLNNNE